MKAPVKKHTPPPGETYRRLLSRYGAQGWWPVTRPGSLTPSYTPSTYRRQREHERFEICVGAILTQNTAWTNVEKAIVNLNREKLLSVQGICGTDLPRLAELIRPSGYYNQKAARLQRFAAYLQDCCGGRMERFFSRPMETVREELLSLNGIGPETADSMLLYAGSLVTFVVDAYTRRMGTRLGWFDGTAGYEAVREFLQDSMEPSLETYNEFHALIVAHCKEHCRATPRCEGCSLRKECLHGSGKKD